jgi:ectoine hydroxylase-related dioxygenase (phytanoyl-CoA dioxygenase family)|tara:strand:- start:2569 stop:3354 length:786 start_codon:yes stop_codon:yes gene_type:complete
MKPENSIELREKGYTIIRNLIDNELLDSLSNKMDVAFIKHRKTQLSNGNDIETGGVALHVLLDDVVFMNLLKHLQAVGMFKFLKEEFFGGKCIVNSLSALDNLPNQPNFSSLVHRDLRFYSGDFPIMVNCLLMVDGFSIENGGTYLLPGSHLEERKPTDKEFFKKAIQVVGNRGDIVIFNSNVWHSSAPNTTQNHRRAIPLTVSRSFMKQLIDYPRALGYNKMDSFTPQLQQLLGYHSRVPSSLNEWYQPENKRFYKKDQD